MARIERVKVRAHVVGGGISASTPNVLSFNVRKTRGQPTSFNCSVKVPQTSGHSIRGTLRIYAGSGGAGNLIITGIITKATVSPCFDDPSYVIVNIAGSDVLKELQYKKYTRRQSAGLSAWCEITSVTRKHLKSSKFKYMRNAPIMKINDGGQDQMTDVMQTTDLASANFTKGQGSTVSRGERPTNVPIRLAIESPEGGNT